MKQPEKFTPFYLSRIYAQGWNAARTAWGPDGAPVNPYDTDPEQTRWQAGFSNAQTDHRKTSQ